MIRYSAAVTVFFLASRMRSVAADAGCSSVIATANEAGLGALTGALTTATADLAASEIGATVLAAAALEADLPEGSRVTIFAPTDVAFQEAADKFGGSVPEDALADVLLNHIVPQELTAATIIALLGESGGSVVVSTAFGSELFVSTDGASIFVQSGGLEAPGATVIIPDQITCAGPVHVIDAVLIPTLPDGSIIPFADAPAPVADAPVVEDLEPAVVPDMVMPDVAPVALVPDVVIDEVGPGVAPAEGPVTGLPPLGFDYADEPYAYGPIADEPFAYEPLGDEPTIAPVADEPLIAPLGDGPIIAPLGDEPSIAPLGDEPSIVDDRSLGPLGAEPSIAPLVGEPAVTPLDDIVAETPEGTEGDLEASDGGTEGDSATVQADTDSAFTPAILSSTIAAVAAAAFLLAV